MARIIDRDKLAGQQDDSAHWDEWAEADEWMPEADEWEPEADDVIDLAPGEPERLGLN
jgi:hypothetical protein